MTQKATIKELKALRAQLKFKLKEEVESMDTELSQQKFQGTTSPLNVAQSCHILLVTTLFFLLGVG